ncbi:hypothetical protein NDU88_001208 [Pleurodeles waltl]|uniref:Uncharacterized protein n=1 Tax=Pleurodeles waltl TaxID=8319 RepID=A0AAV7MN21_PLEWA|nr:hypothetical protein NDU88_001208 [Pleurodeles waltl]
MDKRKTAVTAAALTQQTMTIGSVLERAVEIISKATALVGRPLSLDIGLLATNDGDCGSDSLLVSSDPGVDSMDTHILNTDHVRADSDVGDLGYLPAWLPDSNVIVPLPYLLCMAEILEAYLLGFGYQLGAMFNFLKQQTIAFKLY